MTSLRGRLLLLLSALHAVAALVIAASTYWTADYLDNTFMDGQMHALATSYLHASEPAVPAGPDDETNVHGWGALIVQLWQPGGPLLQTSWPEARVGLQTAEGFHDVTSGRASWRVYTARTAQRTVQIIQSGNFRAAEVRNRALYAALAVLLMTPVSVLLAWLAVRLAVAPLARLSTSAAALDERSLAPLATHDVPQEVRPLVDSINALLERLKAAFSLQRQFTQDAAHELRTPIAALTVQAAELVAQAQASTLAPAARDVHGAAERLARLVAQLLALARTDPRAEVDAEAADLVELSTIVSQVLIDLLPMADARRMDLGLEGRIAAPWPVPPEAARSLFVNLVDNALRYAPAGSRVTLRAVADPDPAIEVLDEGPGVPPAHLQRVFDRFFRVPGAAETGSGLGLAIAQRAAAQAGLRLSLANRPGGVGLVARVAGPSGDARLDAPP